MSANDYPVEEHELRRAADSLHAFNYTSDANTVESALIELLALRARVAKQAALLADLRDAIDSGDRFSYVSGPLRALLDAAIGDAGNKSASLSEGK
jgi:hypothetical protein